MLFLEIIFKMKNTIYIVVILLCSFFAKAQVVEKDIIIIEGDSVARIKDTIHLEEVVFTKEKMTEEERKAYETLRNRVYKTFPYAKIASEKLSILDRNLKKLDKPKDKKRFLKLAESYMQEEFEPRLKKLSRKQGQILVKLINRQTGETTYDLIKEYKSGWKAYWSDKTASVFDIDLKREYDPYNDSEDYVIETILQRAFLNGRLVEQKPAKAINPDDLDKHWNKKKTE